MYKVRAVLRTIEKDLLENIEDHIEVFRKVCLMILLGDDTLQSLLKSISDKKVLRIHYESFNSMKSLNATSKQLEFFMQTDIGTPSHFAD